MSKTLDQIETEVCVLLSRYLRRSINPDGLINRGWGSVAGGDAYDLIDHLEEKLGIRSADFPYDRYFGPEAFFDFEFAWRGLMPRLKRRDPLTARELAAYFFKSQHLTSIPSSA